MMYNVVTIFDAAQIAGVSPNMMAQALNDANVMPVARMLTVAGLVDLYTVGACTQALTEHGEKMKRGSGVAVHVG